MRLPFNDRVYMRGVNRNSLKTSLQYELGCVMKMINWEDQSEHANGLKSTKSGKWSSEDMLPKSGVFRTGTRISGDRSKAQDTAQESGGMQ
jgi:hypothetical protein